MSTKVVFTWYVRSDAVEGRDYDAEHLSHVYKVTTEQDKKTGTLMGEEGSGISKRCLHCSWASPGLAEDAYPGGPCSRIATNPGCAGQEAGGANLHAVAADIASNGRARYTKGGRHSGGANSPRRQKSPQGSGTRIGRRLATEWAHLDNRTRGTR